MRSSFAELKFRPSRSQHPGRLDVVGVAVARRVDDHRHKQRDTHSERHPCTDVAEQAGQQMSERNVGDEDDEEPDEPPDEGEDPSRLR
jgi:hypothetical protein